MSPGFAPAGNAKALVALGFDGTKIDGCGPDRNVTEFAALVDAAAAATAAAASGAAPLPQKRLITIEDCNDDPDWDRGSHNVDRSYDTGCAVSGGGYYRTGGDIFGTWSAVMGRIQSMAGHNQPNQWHTPLARPGCWPTPDALEVGCTRQGPVGMNFTESRSHFGMWCITSSPLVLGLDLRDKEAVDLAWPIITNKAALAVNRAWPHPMPGRMVGTDGAWGDGTVLNITWQVWGKNVTNGSVAVLLVNAADVPQAVSVSFDGLIPCMPHPCNPSPMGDLCFQCKAQGAKGRFGKDGVALDATDLWTGKAMPPVQRNGMLTVQLAPHDSAFVLLKPKAQQTQRKTAARK